MTFNHSNMSSILIVIKNNKSILLHFYIFDFDSTEVISNKITNWLLSKLSYTCIVKIRDDRNDFFMPGSQFGFKFNSYNDITNLVDTVKSKVNEYL